MGTWVPGGYILFGVEPSGALRIANPRHMVAAFRQVLTQSSQAPHYLVPLFHSFHPRSSQGYFEIRAAEVRWHPFYCNVFSPPVARVVDSLDLLDYLQHAEGMLPVQQELVVIAHRDWGQLLFTTTATPEQERAVLSVGGGGPAVAVRTSNFYAPLNSLGEPLVALWRRGADQFGAELFWELQPAGGTPITRLSYLPPVTQQPDKDAFESLTPKDSEDFPNLPKPGTGTHLLPITWRGTRYLANDRFWLGKEFKLLAEAKIRAQAQQLFPSMVLPLTKMVAVPQRGRHMLLAEPPGFDLTHTLAVIVPTQNSLLRTQAALVPLQKTLKQQRLQELFEYVKEQGRLLEAEQRSENPRWQWVESRQSALAQATGWYDMAERGEEPDFVPHGSKTPQLKAEIKSMQELVAWDEQRLGALGGAAFPGREARCAYMITCFLMTMAQHGIVGIDASPTEIYVASGGRIFVEGLATACSAPSCPSLTTALAQTRCSYEATINLLLEANRRARFLLGSFRLQTLLVDYAYVACATLALWKLPPASLLPLQDFLRFVNANGERVYRGPKRLALLRYYAAWLVFSTQERDLLQYLLPLVDCKVAEETMDVALVLPGSLERQLVSASCTEAGILASRQLEEQLRRIQLTMGTPNPNVWVTSPVGDGWGPVQHVHLPTLARLPGAAPIYDFLPLVSQPG